EAHGLSLAAKGRRGQSIPEYRLERSASATSASCRGRTAERYGAARTVLAEHDLVTAFEEGWRLLYEDVSLHVAHRLSATLADVRHLDSEIARDQADIL